MGQLAKSSGGQLRLNTKILPISSFKSLFLSLLFILDGHCCFPDFFALSSLLPHVFPHSPIVTLNHRSSLHQLSLSATDLQRIIFSTFETPSEPWPHILIPPSSSETSVFKVVLSFSKIELRFLKRLSWHLNVGLHKPPVIGG